METILLNTAILDLNGNEMRHISLNDEIHAHTFASRLHAELLRTSVSMQKKQTSTRLRNLPTMSSPCWTARQSSNKWFCFHIIFFILSSSRNAVCGQNGAQKADFWPADEKYTAARYR